MVQRILSIFFLVISITSAAQKWRIAGAEISAMPGMGLHQYTNDSLIFERRKEQGTVSSSAHIPAMLHLMNGSSRSSLYVGLGLRFDDFAMNKYNFSDGLMSILILPFGGSAYNDTFSINSIDFSMRSITLPLGYAYDLTKNKNQGVHFLVRGLLVPGVVFSRQVDVHPDENTNGGGSLTAQDLDRLSDKYRDKIKNFSLFFAPEINLTTGNRTAPLGINIGLQPFAFDFAKPTGTFFKGNTYFRFSFGLTYHWDR